MTIGVGLYGKNYEPDFRGQSTLLRFSSLLGPVEIRRSSNAGIHQTSIFCIENCYIRLPDGKIEYKMP